MINVSDIVSDPFAAQSFTMYRVTSVPVIEGEFNTVVSTISRVGSIQPASQNDIATWVPEGDRSNEYIKVYSNQSLRMADGSINQSDVISWNGGRYRVIAMKHYEDFGYWFAVAEKTLDFKLGL
jgi:hypothetical protein